ncbi:hypothetical protein GCM10027515_05810 [Schumannella luteola]|jgi:uncharacterized protein YciI|uniref:Uncharacterized protein YciI n=1 Tax=Schumannella luteola TaxID=472059 RepID=A0A852Y5R5_9MICO|nr:hypothetical protein [Schumannella luteola]NYG98286.1 uncharacterized protein YciI [Schumannella luteola]TPX05722.1 hypothetical protein FJ656_04620 [Schumannella luteola]
MKAPETWLLLVHREGPASDRSTPKTMQPWFAGHRAFHEELRAEGSLVAAGSLPAADGEELTIVRGIESDDLLARAGADPAVVDGHLLVEVRPWIVVQSALSPLD